MPPPPALVLLAAGGSTRMGRAKQLLPFDGRSLLRHAAQTAIASRARPIIVVLGSEADRCRGELADLPVETIDNPHWPAGIGTSIGVGISALPLDTPAVIVMLCDQPHVTTELLDQLIDMHARGGRTIVASAYADGVGVPALFDASWFNQLRSLEPAAGAKALIRQHPDDVALVPFPAGAIDIDTPADYTNLRNPA